MRLPAWLTRPVWGWSLFDFANQSFTIVILTAMFQVYFVGRIFDDEGTGRRWWAISGIITQAVLIVVGPVLGALADFTGTKKRLLLVTFIGCVGFTFALAFVQPGQAWLGAICFILAYLFYGAGENFLSAFLPELCTHREMGRVSAFSWTIAYVGALISLLVAVGITLLVPGGQETIVGADGAEIVRTSAFGYQLTTAWAALFFALAGLPMFLWVPERKYHEPLPAGQTLWNVGFYRIAETAQRIRQYRMLFRFLAIMTFYFAGMQIIYWFGGTLTKTLFGFDDTRMGLFLVLSTIVAIPSAALTGHYQDRIGTKNTILICLAFWSVVMPAASAAAVFGAAVAWLPWAIGALVGVGIGALGSASRAMVGLFSPPQKSAEFFGFYGIAHKLSAMLGLGWITTMDWLFDHNFALVVVSAAIFFVVGFLLMFFVDEKRGRITALRSAKEIERSATHASGSAADDVAVAPRSDAAMPTHGVPSLSVIYLDNNATTRPSLEASDAVDAALRERWANPSSVHRLGQQVRQQIELARESICRLLGCGAGELVFTSGGTESVNLAIVGSLLIAPSRRVIVTSRLEHSAVRELAEALEEQKRAEVVWLDHEPGGLVDLAALDRLLAARAGEIALVSLMWANNETGLIQPIEEVGRRCRAAKVRFHTDATQWVGKMPLSFESLPVDLLSFAGHKFHGPKGVGGLVIRKGVRVSRQLVGGPQERDRRGGTENVPGILGLAVAAEQARVWLASDGPQRVAAMRTRLEESIIAALPDAVVTNRAQPRLWNTTNIAFPRLEAEAILLLLSERGLCASAGAACSSGSLDPSPVLLAMGIAPEIAHGAIRLSLSRETTESEIDRAIELITAAIHRLRRSSAAVTKPGES